VRQLITEFKQHQKMVVGEVLGQLLARSYREHILTRGSQQQVSKPDLLLPMPLHASRLKLRGFNQAETIARVVSLQTDVAVDSQTCRRIKQTHDQKGLTAKDRRNNVKDAFEVTRTLQGLHVAIVDDVMTTAATVSALSLTLRRAGASFVEIIALARTPAPK
jgi:ComF family protein